jgi:hypothetical protein
MPHEHRIHPEELMNPDLVSEIVIWSSIVVLCGGFLFLLLLAIT